MLVEQTNLYYTQKQAAKASPMIWHDVFPEEMLAFFGMVIAMGVVPMPEYDDYWSTFNILNHPWFPSIFSRDRFKQILRYLHCADNSKTPARDHPDYKLHKVKPLVDHLNHIFPLLYIPSQSVSIDESMVGTKCRVSFIQYMPKKPKKFGIKLWLLCEAMTGYCCQLQVYTGRVEGGAEHGLSHRVVFDLIRQYLNKNYVVYFDNFYTSYLLVKDLLAQRTFSCGTIRSNRIGFPADLRVHERLRRGDAHFRKTNGITAVRWCDKRDVFAMSSLHGNKMQVIPQRRGEGEPIVKPSMIVDYNMYMNGVDKCDQLLVSYALCRKSTKWWVRLFFRLLDMSVINAMVLYLTQNVQLQRKRQPHKKFRLALANELVQPLLDKYADPAFLRPTGAGRPHIAQASRLRGKHFGKAKPPRRRCIICASEKQPNGKYKDTKTVNYCEKCQKYVCRNCFEAYHTKSTYKK